MFSIMRLEVFIMLPWLWILEHTLGNQFNEPATRIGKRGTEEFNEPYQMDTVRRKRIIYGKELNDKNAYSVMTYVVFITHGHQCEAIDPKMEAEYIKAWNNKNEDRANNFKLLNFYIFKQINLHFLCEPLKPEFLHCGGSLLTEFVVQTACHCVSNMLPVNSSYYRPVKNSLWEYPYGLYMNEFIVSDLRHGVRAKFITYHSKCARYLDETTHDYGLIFTGDSMLVKEWKYVKPAPVYTMTEMARFWQQTMREENVCLFVGFGSYRYFKTGIYGPAAPELQHAWRYHMSYHDCYISTFNDTHLNYLYRKSDVTYLDIATWSCSKSFGKNVGFGAPGDSGSPVTCGDQYYGMHTGGVPLWYDMTKRNYTLLHGVTQAIAFSVWENSAQFRNQLNFLAAHFHYAKQYEVPTFRPISRSEGIIHSLVFPMLLFLSLNILRFLQ